MGQNRLQVIVLIELSRIQQTWQNSAEVTDVADIVDIADITDITVKTGRQNMAKYSRIQQITVDYYRLRQSYNQSLITKSVKTGRYI